MRGSQNNQPKETEQTGGRGVCPPENQGGGGGSLEDIWEHLRTIGTLWWSDNGPCQRPDKNRTAQLRDREEEEDERQ
ncbi:hypothetical protein NHX12_027593 [Muraenolepis orangiensis]|uniref:Uncharacterized protein n=1 Tax=Muraenolepis orangiensis TaxID=630683 RepID=A0A9Q0IPD3_9TELE|nr:hypothetical protein NHX12_027593 [Muraenolepis orangiensis]